MFTILALIAVAGPTSQIQTFVVDGVKRQAEVFAPSQPGKNLPIVFVFHGHGGTMQGSEALFNVHGSWPEAIVVYPQGLKIKSQVDPLGTGAGWQFVPGQAGDRDVKFFDAMYNELAQQYSFDKKRVYSMGFSNGAHFTSVLWLEARPTKLAAVAEAAGLVDAKDKPLQPLPAFMMAGQLDTTTPYLEQRASIKYLRGVNGVPPSATAPVVSVLRHYNGSHADLDVYIHTGGHAYPTSMAATVVSFFKHHPQP